MKLVKGKELRQGMTVQLDDEWWICLSDCNNGKLAIARVGAELNLNNMKNRTVGPNALYSVKEQAN